MKLEQGLNPNCSEAVFRFYTEDPDVARKILQAFADEVARAVRQKPETVPSLSTMGEVAKVAFGACAGLGERESRLRDTTVQRHAK